MAKAKESDIRSAAKALLGVTLDSISSKITEEERVKKSNAIISDARIQFGVEANQILSYSTQNFKILKSEIEADELKRNQIPITTE